MNSSVVMRRGPVNQDQCYVKLKASNYEQIDCQICIHCLVIIYCDVTFTSFLFPDFSLYK